MADIEEIQICPLCGRPVKASGSVDYNGQSCHPACAAAEPPHAHNPYDSYT